MRPGYRRGQDGAIEAVERLVQPPAPDPVVALWEEWRKVRCPIKPADVDDETFDEIVDQAGSRMNELEPQILAAPATSLVGSFAQLSVLIYQLDPARPGDEEEFFGLRKGIEATLAGIVAGQGDAS